MGTRRRPLGHSGRRLRIDRAMLGPSMQAMSPSGRGQPPGQLRPRARGRRASNSTRPDTVGAPPTSAADRRSDQGGEVRIKATCSKCRRDLLLSQLVEAPGSPADAHGAGRCWPRSTPYCSPTPSGAPSAPEPSWSGPLSDWARAGPGFTSGPNPSLTPPSAAARTGKGSGVEPHRPSSRRIESGLRRSPGTSPAHAGPGDPAPSSHCWRG